jgi:hypothetical protein
VTSKKRLKPAEETTIQNSTKARAHDVRPTMKFLKPKHFSADFDKTSLCYTKCKQIRMFLLNEKSKNILENPLISPL